MKIEPSRLGLVLGAFMGTWHAVWSLMVAFNLAQPFMDMVFGLHFITPPYVIGSFSLLTALGLIIFTSCFGYVCGWVLGQIWNYIMGKK